MWWNFEGMCNQIKHFGSVFAHDSLKKEMKINYNWSMHNYFRRIALPESNARASTALV